MSMHTGENEQGLKKIIDMTRMIAIVILLIHCYYFCYEVFVGWKLTSKITDQLLKNIYRTGLLNGFLNSKLIALGLLLLSLIGVKGRKHEKLKYGSAVGYFVIGLTFYFCSAFVLILSAFEADIKTITYITANAVGILLVISGGSTISRIIRKKLNPDVFNKANETFPQEERLLTNEYSINIPAAYNLKGKIRKSWINIINPARGVLVIGSPGSGKSRFFVEPAIGQLIEKGHAMFVYDYKYPDLTNLAHNHYLLHKDKYPTPPTFWIINFDEIVHRCNPIHPSMMHDITDAVEAARIILLGLNRSWLKKQGEFFVESPINFVTALIWFLRKYQDGEFCTIPHVIELMQVEIEKLFTILRTEPEIEAYINPFISAYMTNSMEQLEGQLDAAKISMARLSSPALYYVMSGNDLMLDINNPNSPKILCLANNPQKQDVYGPVLSLYMTRMSKIINRKNQLKSALVIDEFPTLTFLGLDTLIATGRSNLISTILALQSDSQLRLNYGKEWADVITNICGNLIVGQISGEIAKSISEKLGKTLQDRENISINSNDTSISRSKQLELVVPVSKIAGLSSGEFVGLVADNPDEKIELKTFHSNFAWIDKKRNRIETIQHENDCLLKINQQEIIQNYKNIKQDIQDVVNMVFEHILSDPIMETLIIKR